MQVRLLTHYVHLFYNKNKFSNDLLVRKGESSVRCPFCNQDNTRVVDSRPVEDTNSIRRRRLCDACGKRFTTYEKVETIPLTVIKKDQNRESYKRSKIQDGVLRACYKRPIPIESGRDDRFHRRRYFPVRRP